MTGVPGKASTEGADVLRGIAILMVVVYHAFGPNFGYHLPWAGWQRDFSASPSTALLWFYPITFGWTGVALFFVISGFCIHYSYLRSGTFDARLFFWRRFWRIYPAYFVALVFFFGLSRAGLFTPNGAKQFVSHALFLHNFSGDTFFGINGSFWSIATEFQLYLLFPALLYLRDRMGIERSVACLFLVGCGWRAVSVLLGGLPEHVIYWVWASPLMTWFDWGLGALVAERLHSGRRTFRRPGLWLAIFLPLFVVSTFFKPLTMFSFTLAAMASAVLLDAGLHVRWTGRAAGFLVFTGTISYSLYLWHQPLLFRITDRLAAVVGSSMIAWAALLPILLGGAWISFRLLERPGIELGRRLWNRIPKAEPQAGRAGPAQPNDSTRRAA